MARLTLSEPDSSGPQYDGSDLLQRQIVQIIGCTHSTIIRFAQSYLETEFLQDHQCSGRQRVTTFIKIIHYMQIHEVFRSAIEMAGIHSRQASIKIICRRQCRVDSDA